MGPALAILAFGAPAAVPVALIFCFDNTLHFVMAPLLMALSGNDKRSPRDVTIGVLRKIFGHPFIIATIMGVGAAILGIEPPVAIDRMIDLLAKAAAPCALFAMGATLALRPLRRVPKELYLIVPIKLLVQPATDLWGAEPCWEFSAGVDLHRHAHGGIAHRNQCLCHRPTVWRLGRTGLQQHSGDHLVFNRDPDALALFHDAWTDSPDCRRRRLNVLRYRR